VTTFTIRPVFNSEARIAGDGYVPDETIAHLGAWIDGFGNLKENYSVALPASVAEGVADGRLPSDALVYSTSNAGGSWGTNLNGFIDACNTANVAGIIDQDVSPSSIGSKHIYRGLYGVAVSGRMPILLSPSRVTARFSPYRHDIKFRGIRFKNFGWLLRCSRLAVPLTLGGSVDTTPYLSGASDIWNNARSTDGFPTTFCQRVADIDFVSGSGDVEKVEIYRRPVNGLPPSAETADTWAGWLPLFEGYVDGVDDDFPQLISSTVTGATAATLADAINAGTATHNHVAEAVGDCVQLYCTANYKEPLHLNIVTTGTLVVTQICRQAAIDFSCCEFEDCNVLMAGHCETAALGPIDFHFNLGVGSWSIMAFSHTRQSRMRVTANDWGNATGSREMPSASNTSGQNSIIMAGNNYPGLMRFNECDHIVEHNYFHDVESSCQVDTNNSAVAIDLRSLATDRILDDINVVVGTFRVRWNKIVGVKCLVPAIDANAIYLKPRGVYVENNYIEDTGAAGEDGSFIAEATGILCKENLSNTGMPQTIIRGNTYRNMPEGRPVLKIDNQQNLLVDYEDFENWRNYIDDTVQTDPAHSGLIRITGKVAALVIRSLRMVNIDLGGQALAVNIHNLDLNGTGDEFELSNIDIQNDGSADYPAWTTDTLVARFDTDSSLTQAYFDLSTMGRLRLLDAAGDPVGDWLVRNSDAAQNITIPDNAADLPFSAYSPA
jgi:hypothetical protein